MNTAAEILRKHEDANEMHFHEVDRKFIIEAMEEYAKEKSEKPINLSSKKTEADIYTKEQVKQMIDMAHNGYDGYYDIMSPFAPIYLPDTDDLKEISKHEILYNEAKRSWWFEGAEYIINLIKLQLDGKETNRS